ncbi:pyridoxamine 5'-phosphate oxidase [Rhodococcus sp. D2-41]|uniref:Pyridoxal 5'-phosphate synthase n=1 Tax=Speluncibacter jeojiensis TaxID=2710754 RepID=A0A9X4LZZ3_9ACTN|nr:pyridoxal 5'-phosphate synthase [Rhodococcus sp. D2-41]MDG3010696.1 pyridoxamine 5'-phosphate oxidase [Rhodococcus sp. D2-41]MDG3013677.1 pyridoxal 5'-phosphate synthase [Corynebacteriales bacterium D3-21]
MLSQAVPAGGMRSMLRGLPVLNGAGPPFDPLATPDNPVELFVDWLLLAIRSNAVEPHTMTLSTVDNDGRPSARVLILKDVDASGWHFGVNADSQKGRDLAARPVAALTFYWPELVRQVRISGPVVADPAEVTGADFLARPTGSKAMALTRRQSQPFLDPAELDAALDQARSELDSSPNGVPDEWVSYAVRPERVEFWQGDPTRRHQRIRYDAVDRSWTRTRLWP